MKPLTTIQAEARAAFKSQFVEYQDDYKPHIVVYKRYDGMETNEAEDIMAFLDTQLSLAHAAGKAEGREGAVSLLMRIAEPMYNEAMERDGYLLYEGDFKEARLPDTEENN